MRRGRFTRHGRRILEHDGSASLRVNLLLNRASPWADLDSHLPYRGQVDLRVKQDVAEVKVRIPGWADRGTVAATVGAAPADVASDDGYVRVGPVPAGSNLTLRFPIRERHEHVFVEKQGYGLILRGDEVVSIEPRGVHCPLYQRDHLRTTETRWRNIERFVSSETIRW